jgi:hypothetical protein
VLCFHSLPLPCHAPNVCCHREIDRLLKGYANLDYWVADVDKRIEGILLQRLTQIIQVVVLRV